MSSIIARLVPPNTAGNDYAVGDIHGCFSKLVDVLNIIKFDPAVDRLFSVGDLVDRGPESEKALEWLTTLPWFIACRGNHEQDAIDASTGYYHRQDYITNGGEWFLKLNHAQKMEHTAAFERLPHAITVPTADGLVGLVHANVPTETWQEFIDPECKRTMVGTALHDRTRLQFGDKSVVKGVRAVFVGHTPLKKPAVLGNVYHIDTGAVFKNGHFTIYNIKTLEQVYPAAEPAAS